MKYTIIASGSKGNAVLIGDILVDMGVSWKLIEPYKDKIKHVLITHSHMDHFRKGNLKHLRKKDILTNPLVAKTIHEYFQDKGQFFKKVVAMGHEDVVELGKYKITAFRCYHDVVCIGFKVEVIKTGEKFIYATDTSSTIDFIKDKYNQVFIESNYDGKKVNKAMGNNKSYLRAKRNLRHLEKRKALQFYLENSAEGAEFIELHKSENFY